MDEEHKYRNSNTKRWKNTRKLQRKSTDEQNKFILLTATPINNSIRDVYNLIRLFMDDTFKFFKIKGVEVDELHKQIHKTKKRDRNRSRSSKEKRTQRD